LVVSELPSGLAQLLLLLLNFGANYFPVARFSHLEFTWFLLHLIFQIPKCLLHLFVELVKVLFDLSLAVFDWILRMMENERYETGTALQVVDKEDKP
jgi:hypothetical protein